VAQHYVATAARRRGRRRVLAAEVDATKA